VENRCWGRAKVTHYLLRKGIAPEVINTVQKKIWQEFNEEDVARTALRKHYRGYSKLPSIDKRARFLKARGFSADVIYRCSGISSTDITEEA
jgi:SOS response regulatory protein OraA/RecX